MSKNYPDTVPHPHDAHEDLARAYRIGWSHGHGLACHNVPRLGDKLRLDSIGRVTVDVSNIRDVHAELCFAAEENSRQYSPFEFTAHEFNSSEDGGWRVCYDHDDMSEETYETEAEAVAAGEAEGWGPDVDVIEVQSSEDLWSAFEAGTADAIFADLAEYDDESYGIEAE
jgi:hypothetical protein